MTDLSPDEKLEQNAFSEGFGNDPPPTSTTAEVKPEPAPIVETPAEPTPAPPVPEPALAKITQEQWDALQAAANKTAGFEAKLDKAFGTLGQLQQTIGKLKGTPVAEPATEQPKEPEERPDWKQALHAASVAYQMEALEDIHPTWREIVGAPDSEGKINQDNPFRKWLATQPAEYQAKINAANSAVVISRAIDKFNEAAKTVAAAPAIPKPAPKVVARQTVIRAAIQPKGDGGQPAPSKTDADAFAEGFSGG